MKVNMFCILLPAILLCLVVLVVSDSDNLIMGLYNGEVSVEGTCPYKYGCTLKNLSCRYLAHLRNHSITVVDYGDIKSAIDAANSQKVAAAIYFSENFTDAFVARIALGEDSDDETIREAQIRVWLDNKGKNANILTQRLKSAYKDFTEDFITVCESDRLQSNEEGAFFNSPLAIYDTDSSDSKSLRTKELCGSLDTSSENFKSSLEDEIRQAVRGEMELFQKDLARIYFSMSDFSKRLENIEEKLSKLEGQNSTKDVKI